jgi:hypothetical protein
VIAVADPARSPDAIASILPAAMAADPVTGAGDDCTTRQGQAPVLAAPEPVAPGAVHAGGNAGRIGATTVMSLGPLPVSFPARDLP